MIFPVTIGVPLTIMTIPPAVVLVPAALTLCVQVAPPLISLMAALTVFANRLIQFRFRAFNIVLALCMLVRIRLGDGNEHRRTQSRRHYRRCRNTSNSLNFHADLLSEFGPHYFD